MDGTELGLMGLVPSNKLIEILHKVILDQKEGFRDLASMCSLEHETFLCPQKTKDSRLKKSKNLEVLMSTVIMVYQHLGRHIKKYHSVCQFFFNCVDVMIEQQAKRLKFSDWSSIVRGMQRGEPVREIQRKFQLELNKRQKTAESGSRTGKKRKKQEQDDGSSSDEMPLIEWLNR